jgi:hypothetical protein
MLAVHTIGWFDSHYRILHYACNSYQQLFQHTCNAHHETTLAYLQFTLSSISIKLTATLSTSHHTYNSHFDYSYYPCNSHYRTSHHAHSHTIECAFMIYSSHNRTIHHPCTSHYRVPNHAYNPHHQIIHHACNYTIEYTIMNNEFPIKIRSTAPSHNSHKNSTYKNAQIFRGHKKLSHPSSVVWK